ncbi:O-fucosyltransferase 10-like [Cynara cardunculus var. scolymus]|uniref:O-fucosyltransferase 10-like n=1 Tax=Cynara cardunculus var. scolymus TaxID=59895 RepID=UPI000D62B34B|nr:O-fucosyltransferase 10-like [Cynara cardunculus var. scolymus]
MDATFNYYSGGSSSNLSSPTSPRATHSTRRRLRSHQHRRRDYFLNRKFFRRKYFRYLLLLPLLYFSGVLSCLGSLSAMLYPSPLPGSVYRSHEIFQSLLTDIQSDTSLGIQLSEVWRYKSMLKEQKPCLKPTSRQQLESGIADQYLIVEANGGLNQQRASICNAVAVAGLLNATLLIPRFNFHKVWRDASEFGDIYDEEHFIATLKRYVDVVREIPKELMEEYDFNISNIPSFRVPAWASAGYYLKEVYPVLKEQRIVRVAPFANRLASSLPPHIQYLRCLANYEALRFSISITTLANTLVKRMTADSSGSGGKYVSVHLRFEEDMVAFSCCVYDGGKSEQLEMDSIRQKGWGEKFKRKDYVIAPGRNRMNGRCPMTPLEVGMMLRGMGFANTTPIYLASGKIYQAGKNLAPLRKLFPLLHTKELLATPNELASLKGYSSRLAALDYIVCFFSEVFVTTQGGNFPQFLMGHRKFHYGHAKTIIPDKRKLAVLLHNTSISWHALKNEMQVMLDESDHKGVAIPTIKKTKRKNSIFANPLPQCQCLQESKFS